LQEGLRRIVNFFLLKKGIGSKRAARRTEMGLAEVAKIEARTGVAEQVIQDKTHPKKKREASNTLVVLLGKQQLN